MAGAINGTVVVVNNATGVVVGQGDFTHTYDGKLIEVTTKDSGDGTDYMEGENSGKQHIFSGEFIYNGETQFRNTRDDVFSVTAREYTLAYISDSEIDESFAGDFFPTDLNDIVPQGGAMKTTIAFKSNSIVTTSSVASPLDYDEYYPMNDADVTTGTTYKVYNSTATVEWTMLNGTTGQEVAGFIGDGALRFQTNQYLRNLQTNADWRATTFSYSTWFYLGTGGAIQTIAQSWSSNPDNNGWLLRVWSTDRIHFQTYGAVGATAGTVYPTNILPTSTWLHIVVTRTSGGSLSVYLNGSVIGTAQETTPIVYNAAENLVLMGARQIKIPSSPPTEYLVDSRLDDVKFWKDRAISVEEVSAMYTADGGV